jgi:hypothetical protein
MVNTIVVVDDLIYKFVFLISFYLELFRVSNIYFMFTYLNFWNFKTILDGDMSYTKVAVLDKI